MNKEQRFRRQMLILGLLILVTAGLYLTYNTYGNWSFALAIRGKKLAAFFLVALACSGSTVAFQTLTHNRFLTPGILGMDQLYVTVQTVLFFIAGGSVGLSLPVVPQFLVNVLLMAVVSVLFIGFFLGKTGNDFFRLLMVGMVAASLFSSISTYLQVLMDPNEYDLLQGKLYASFGNVSVELLVISGVLLAVICSVLWYFGPELDVLLLGFDHGVNLGISVRPLQRLLLFLIAAATGIATALVGPTIFLGFVVATVSYQIFPVHRHRQLFLGSTLLGILFLIGGQFIVEQFLGLKATISTVIQFAGGLFFIGKLVAGSSPVSRRRKFGKDK